MMTKVFAASIAAGAVEVGWIGKCVFDEVAGGVIEAVRSAGGICIEGGRCMSAEVVEALGEGGGDAVLHSERTCLCSSSLEVNFCKQLRHAY